MVQLRIELPQFHGSIFLICPFRPHADEIPEQKGNTLGILWKVPQHLDSKPDDASNNMIVLYVNL